jgi:hypothetical protein
MLRGLLSLGDNIYVLITQGKPGVQGLHRSPSLIVATLVSFYRVIPSHKIVEVCLDIVNRTIELLMKGYFIDLLLNRLINSFYGPVDLRMPNSME